MNKILVILISALSGANFTSFAYEGLWPNFFCGLFTLSVATFLVFGEEK